MNVLGVTFDCKLNYDTHIANAISKAKKSLFALRLLKNIFFCKWNENPFGLKFSLNLVLQCCDMVNPWDLYSKWYNGNVGLILIITSVILMRPNKKIQP